MSSAEPVDFLRERRRRRPGEKAPVEQPPQQESPPVLPPRPEPEAKPERKPEPKKGPRCSCCGFPAEKVKVFFDLGRGVLLCDGCIKICNEILSEEGVAPDTAPPRSTNTSSSSLSYSARTKYRCSFCGKEQERVARLIAMLNNLFICNGCVGICNAGIAQALSDAPTEAKEGGETRQEDEPVSSRP